MNPFFPVAYWCQATHLHFAVNSMFLPNKSMENTNIYVVSDDKTGEWWVYPKVMGTASAPAGTTMVTCSWDDVVARIHKGTVTFDESCLTLGAMSAG